MDDLLNIHEIYEKNERLSSTALIPDCFSLNEGPKLFPLDSNSLHRVHLFTKPPNEQQLQMQALSMKKRANISRILSNYRLIKEKADLGSENSSASNESEEEKQESRPYLNEYYAKVGLYRAYTKQYPEL